MLIILQHFYPNQFLLYLIILLFNLSICSIVIAIYTRKNIEIETDYLIADYHCGNEIDLKYIGNMKHIFSPTQLKIRIKNLHTKTERYNDFSYITYNENEYNWRYPLRQIGTYEIKLESIVVHDFFRIVHFKKSLDKVFQFNVYPIPKSYKERDIIEEIIYNDGESVNERGLDFTEIFAFHEYQDGEYFKHVHPILSAKYDKYIMKEGSDSQKKVYIYPIPKCKDFDRLSPHLFKIYQLFITVVLEQDEFFYIRYENKDIPIYSHYDLYSVMNELYKEYLV